jgi:benzoyl-CoA reductase/2-hydroxyglutaryl-CoA dehydratase subunit BcrC/BadD/HgdB
MSDTPLHTPPRRSEYLQRQKREHGRHLCGVFPAQYPREILWALDILPVEIWDPPLQPHSSGAHLQPYICSVARMGLELLLQGQGNALDLLLFPHTCDSLQNLASVVRDYIGFDKPCYFFYQPKAPHGAAARKYYEDRLRALAGQLAKPFGPLDHERLVASVDQGQRISALLATLYEKRTRGRLAASATEFYRLIRSGEYLHPDDFAPALEAFLSATGDAAAPGHEATVVLSGILPHPPELLSLLDTLGVRVGHDDLLSCGRRLLVPPSRLTDPFAALTEQWLGLPPCSTRNSPLAERRKHLLEQIVQSGASGVIFNMVKFCETEFFDVPALADALRENGIHSLVLESELNDGLSGQLTTRVEAFVEILTQGAP